MKRPFKPRKQKAVKKQKQKLTKFRLGATKQQAHFFVNMNF